MDAPQLLHLSTKRRQDIKDRLVFIQGQGQNINPIYFWAIDWAIEHKDDAIFRFERKTHKEELHAALVGIIYILRNTYY